MARGSRKKWWKPLWISVVLVVTLVPGVPPASAAAGNLPAGFTVTPVITGLTLPTAVQFSPDGRVFVIEKRGTLKVWSSLSDTTADVPLNLASEVYDWWDRGLLGLALHPDFPATPYVYLLYTWDVAGYNDGCPANPGQTTDGCMANGRLLRVEISPSNQVVGSPLVLLEGNWCQQYPSHSIGSLDFGPEGALYVSGGDGASFNVVDYGQLGGTLAGSPTPRNPCSDPVNEGGALRSQDLRTSGDPVTFDGTVLRIDPLTGAAWPSNPLVGGDPGDDRIIAYGLRNPFRMTVAGDGQVWIGDVGWGTWEEINRIPDPDSGPVQNFGWPCYEGTGRQGGYDAANLPVCETLYTSGGQTAPHFTYQHGIALRSCPEQPGSTSAITGLAFYEGGSYPASYDGALFFTDYSRSCIWMMQRGPGNLPNPTDIVRFATGEPSVGLYVGPAGDIFTVDHINGAVKRISFSTSNQAPSAVAQATPTNGSAPLTVSFDGAGSTDVDGDPLTYAWDLDGDGLFDDAFTSTTSFTYTEAGSHLVGLRVDDGRGGSNVDQVTITVGGAANTPPTVQITAPTADLAWTVGQKIDFAGTWTDAEDDQLPDSALRWSLVIHHCAPNVPTDCHQHPLTTFIGSSDAFTAPDHEFPAYLELTFTVTDSGGLSASTSVRLDPQTVALAFATAPAGLQLNVGGRTLVAPFGIDMIVNGRTTIGATSPQTVGAATYDFVSWSDGGAASHQITAATANSYVATFNGRPTARVTASVITGRVPTTVTFNASTSTDPEGRALVFSWDLNGDGQFTDGPNSPSTSFTYTAAGTYLAKVRVVDSYGAASTAQVKITIKKGNGPR